MTPLPDLDEAPEVCWRCGHAAAGDLRRLTVSYMSRIQIVERVLCRACLQEIEVVVKQPAERVLQADL